MTKIVVKLGRRSDEIYHLDIDSLLDLIEVNGVEIYEKAFELTKDVSKAATIMLRVSAREFEYE